MDFFTISLFFTVQLYAFNGSRKGFVLGFAGGLSYTSYEHKAAKLVEPKLMREVTDTYPYKDSGVGLATNFILGYGFTDQFILHYTNNVAWFLKRDIDFTYGISHINTDCLINFGMIR